MPCPPFTVAAMPAVRKSATSPAGSFRAASCISRGVPQLSANEIAVVTRRFPQSDGFAADTTYMNMGIDKTWQQCLASRIETLRAVWRPYIRTDRYNLSRADNTSRVPSMFSPSNMRAPRIVNVCARQIVGIKRSRQNSCFIEALVYPNKRSRTDPGKPPIGPSCKPLSAKRRSDR